MRAAVSESISEDKVESYHCDQCQMGIVTKSEDGMFWECDYCNFKVETERNINNDVTAREIHYGL